ncbi:hypothetical protein HNP46_000460 [Pseudomonas nitritireducens]|uniref:Uncharacterized protein n=1 Tax=Pseudomonas nitroreducens TaxID=46680 RepID=A0A7W7NZJ0_PSENT|nr:hypothetical protein [Pseudomonas nitritireducens]MBB4861649.1 hypothetical protein [Pseudomonas nitritireducens]
MTIAQTGVQSVRFMAADSMLRCLLAGVVTQGEGHWKDLTPSKLKLELVDGSYFLEFEGERHSFSAQSVWHPQTSRFDGVSHCNRWYKLIHDAGLDEAGDFSSPFFELLRDEQVQPINGLPLHFREPIPASNLPDFDGDHVRHPELLIALRKGLEKHQNKAYRHVLCWASPMQVALYPQGLIPFESRPRLIVSEEAEKCVVDLGYLDEPRARQAVACLRTATDPGAGPGQDVVRLEFDITAGGDVMQLLDRELLVAMGSTCTKLGLAAAPDRVLCRTSIDFLEGFSMEPPDAEVVGSMETLLGKYFPMGLMLAEPDRFGDFRKTESKGFTITSYAPGLLRIISREPEAMAHASRYLPRQLLQHCVVTKRHEEADRRLTLQEFSLWRDLLGVPDAVFEGKTLFISREAARTELFAKTDLLPGMNIYTKTGTIDTAEARRDHYRVILDKMKPNIVLFDDVDIRMPLGKVMTTLASFYERKSSARGNKMILMEALLLHAGPAEAVKFVRTAKQGSALLQLMGGVALGPYMHMLPDEIATKGAVMELDL